MKKLLITIFILLLSFTFSLNNASAEEPSSKAGFKKQANQSVVEVEPNDTNATATTIHSLDEVQGSISEEDTDVYKLEMLRKGEFSLYSFLGNGDDDNYYYYNNYDVTIYDVNGNMLAISDYFQDDNTNYYRYLQTTLEKGTYYISVKTDGYSYMGTQSYYLWPEVAYTADFTITSLTANLTSPQIERKTITFQAGASKTGLQYQFSVDGRVVKGYNSASTYQWTPTSPGTYKIKVQARDPQFISAVIEKEISYTIYAYKPDFSITSLTPNIKSPNLLGKTITFATKIYTKTNYNGIQYQFSVNGKVVQAFGTKGYLSWKPTRAGKYAIKLEVCRSQYPNRIVSRQLAYDITDGKVYISSLKSNVSSPRPTSSSIKWTATAKGVNLEYKFSVYQNKKWTTIQNYSTKNYTYWKPKREGASKVMVTVRSNLSKKTAVKTVNYTIFKPSYFSTPSLKSNISTKQVAGKYFYFTAKSSGSYLEYRFRIYNGYSWYTLQNYSSSKSVYWYASYDGNYKVAVDVRQKGTNKVKTNRLSLDIREAPSNNMSYNYSYNYNYGSMTFTNYGYNNMKVTKIQFTNNGKSYYTYSPKNWTIYGRTYQTYYFYPSKPLYDFSWNTVVKVYYTFDGMNYVTNMYRTY